MTRNFWGVRISRQRLTYSLSTFASDKITEFFIRRHLPFWYESQGIVYFLLKYSNHNYFSEPKNRDTLLMSLCILNRSNNRIEVSFTGLIHQIITAAAVIIIHHPGIGVKTPINPKITKTKLNIHRATRGQFIILKKSGWRSTILKIFSTYLLSFFLDFLLIQKKGSAELFASWHTVEIESFLVYHRLCVKVFLLSFFKKTTLVKESHFKKRLKVFCW